MCRAMQGAGKTIVLISVLNGYELLNKLLKAGLKLWPTLLILVYSATDRARPTRKVEGRGVCIAARYSLGRLACAAARERCSG